MFITPAYAQASGGLGTTDMLVQFAPLIFVFAIMYVLLFRPQQKRAAEHKLMIKNVRRGDTIVTNGGIVGRVTKVIDDNELEAEIADNVLTPSASPPGWSSWRPTASSRRPPTTDSFPARCCA